MEDELLESPTSLVHVKIYLYTPDGELLEPPDVQEWRVIEAEEGELLEPPTTSGIYCKVLTQV